MGRLRYWLIAFLCLSSASALADDATPDQRIWFSTVYVSQWVSTSLPKIPYSGATGELQTADAYFAGVGIGRTLIPSFSIPLPFCGCGMQNFRLETEAQFVQHFGLEHTPEIAAALIIRTPPVPLFLGVSVDAAVGEGGSDDLAEPTFEGTVKAQGAKAPGPRHFLNFMIYELEFSQENWKNWHFVVQIHHRSGVWGVIAPKDSGGNYLGFGLRADFM